MPDRRTFAVNHKIHCSIKEGYGWMPPWDDPVIPLVPPGREKGKWKRSIGYNGQSNGNRIDLRSLIGLKYF
jgi:hypothetical protein